MNTEYSKAKRFCELLAGDEQLTFQTFKDHKSANVYAEILHGKLDDHFHHLAHMNNRGAGIFLAVNRTDGRGRSTENVTGIRAVFADLDGSPLGPVRECALTAHIIVESSPGHYHAYWLVTPDFPLDMFSIIQKGLAARFNSDQKVCDLPRAMRLPGFLHSKGEPFLTRIMHVEPDLPRYSLERIVEGLGLDLSPKASSDEAPRKIGFPTAQDPVTILSRNNSLTSFVGSRIARGLSREEVEILAREYANKCSPPLGIDEAMGVVTSVWKTHRRNHPDDQATPLLSTETAAHSESAMIPLPRPVNGLEEARTLSEVIRLMDLPMPAGLNETIMVPDGYSIQHRQTLKVSWDKKREEVYFTKVAPTILILLNLAEDIRSGVQSMTLAWWTDRRWKTLTVDKSDIADPRAMLGLASRGLPVSAHNSRDISKYLFEFEHANEGSLPVTRVTSQTGWIDASEGQLVFMYGKCLIHRGGDSPPDLEFRAIDPGHELVVEGFRQSGAYEAWSEAVEAGLRHPRVAALIYGSLTAPLLMIVKARNICVDLSAITSTGKTVAMRLAASIWGDPDESVGGGVLRTWALTPVYAERVAAWRPV